MREQCLWFIGADQEDQKNLCNAEIFTTRKHYFCSNYFYSLLAHTSVIDNIITPQVAQACLLALYCIDVLFWKFERDISRNFHVGQRELAWASCGHAWILRILNLHINKNNKNNKSKREYHHIKYNILRTIWRTYL